MPPENPFWDTILPFTIMDLFAGLPGGATITLLLPVMGLPNGQGKCFQDGCMMEMGVPSSQRCQEMNANDDRHHTSRPRRGTINVGTYIPSINVGTYIPSMSYLDECNFTYTST